MESDKADEMQMENQFPLIDFGRKVHHIIELENVETPTPQAKDKPPSEDEADAEMIAKI